MRIFDKEWNHFLNRVANSITFCNIAKVVEVNAEIFFNQIDEIVSRQQFFFMPDPVYDDVRFELVNDCIDLLDFRIVNFLEEFLKN